MTKENKETAPVATPYKFIEDAPEGRKILFRLSLDGDVTEGHYINRRVHEPTGAGQKFVITKDRGFVFIENTDWGWSEQVAVEDDSGKAFDYVERNHVGYAFDNKPFGTVEAAIKAGVDWLREKEKERVKNEFN